MNRKNLAPEGEKEVDSRRGSSQPLHTVQTTACDSSFAASNTPLKSTMEDMRRRIVHLNKELEQERMHSKNLKRDKALEIRQVRDEEQRKAAAMQADLRSKLHKEKINEITALKEQLHKEKEKDIIQVMRQKDEALRNAQQAWAKEKEEMKLKLRNELRSESREDTKREFEKERGRLEQEIADLNRQKRELEETLKLVQGADKRKIDDIRRIHHEHEAELEKFKRNSWQESRQQMAEIRQLLNIIEQLEKKLGLEAGHTMRLRLEKDSLYDMLKKSTTYDAWDRMMSSTMKEEQGQNAPPATSDLKHGNQELRMLQRKNVELSSLVRKLDEKNQQLATRNAELLAELEKLEKDNRDKNRKLERKNADLTQTNKRLESRNKMLLDEINTLKKSSASRKDNSIKPRGHAAKEQDELGNLRAQLREQTRNIADLKQSLMDKDRRIELLRSRKKKSKRQSPTTNPPSGDFLSVEEDDALSVHSDFSEASEMSSSDDVDSKRIKKLAKELLALERAYALLQAHVGSAVDAERDEMEKQQLQSDLIESQTRIHELERMMDEGGQGAGSKELSQIQADNKALYQKLVMAEKERDKAQAELTKYTEDVRELKDQRDLLEFELEEMSQLSTAGSEDWDSRRPRSTCSLEAFPTARKDSSTSDLSLEEIKACLEELETEKESVLSPLQQSALKQARVMLESMAEKINHMEITESALRDKVRDLDLGYNSKSLKSEFGESSRLSMFTYDKETLTDLQWVELKEMERFYNQQELETLGHWRRAEADIPTEDTCCMTDLVWEDLVSMESIYRKHMRERDVQHELEREDKECMTDLAWQELADLEESYRNYLEDFTDGNHKGKGRVNVVDNQTATDLDLEELEKLESSYQTYLEGKVSIQLREDTETMTDMIWEEILQRTNDEIYLILSNEIIEKSKKRKGDTSEVGVMTDLVLSELVEMEEKYWEYIDNESKISVQNEDLVETLPEIVLDTFPEDVTNTKDEYTMTDLKWNDVVHLQDKCYDYERIIQELERKVALLEVEKDEKGSCTEMTFTDLTFDDLVNLEDKCRGYECIIKELETNLAHFEIEKDEKGSCTEVTFSDLTFDELVNLEDKCRGYECIIKELETKLAHSVVEKDEKGSCTEMTFTDLTFDELVNLEDKCRGYECVIKELETKLTDFEIVKDEKGSCTELSLQDLAQARLSVETKDAETMTGVPEDVIDNEGLPEIVLATFPGEIQTKDECDMTEGVWDEVVDLKNTYQDYRQNLEEMKQKLAQFEVEKDDKESITDIAMQDLADLESLYREHLREDDSDSTSLLSHLEKESKECMTELTFIEITELEDFYIENAARQIAASPVVEKWEQESMTDITLDDMQYLEEAEDLFRCSGSAAEKGEKYTETMTEMFTQSKVLEVAEKVEVDTMTELTIPDLELLEVTQELHQSCPVHALDTLDKKDRSVGTELTAEDLNYWEEVEAAHEECLLDREENEGKAERGGEEKQDAEIMTEFTMMDLYYLEEVDAAHEECLLDRKETEGKADRGSEEKQDAEMMTEFTMIDLYYLEEVDAAHEECLFDRDEGKAERGSEEKQDAEMMTEFTMIDLYYLQEVDAAHEECLVDRENERKVDIEKLSTEVMTEMTVSDLQYLEDVESAHEECIVDRKEDFEASDVEKQNAEIMTDLTVLDLQYLEDVEMAREESLVDKQKELEGDVVKKESVEIMTDLTVLDLRYLEDVEAAHEECLVDKQEELNGKDTTARKESAGSMTEMTMLDLQYLVDKQEQLESRSEDKQNAEIMTDMKISDLQYLEDVEATHEECLADKQKGLQHVSVGKENAAVMTDLTASDLQYLKDIETAHEECLLDKEVESKVQAIDSEKQSVGTMTDMTNHDLRSLESTASEKEKTKTPKFFRRRSRSSSLTDHHDHHHQHKNTMTEITGNILDYYKEIEVLYKETMVEFDEFKRLHSADKEEKDVMTDVTVEDLELLEEERLRLAKESLNANMDQKETKDKETITELLHGDLAGLAKESLDANVDQKETEDKETITELLHGDLEYLMEVESLYKEGNGDQESKILVPQSDEETMTEVTSSYIEHVHVEEELDRLQHVESHAKDSSWVFIESVKEDKNVMTEMTESELHYLEKVEALYNEKVAESTEITSEANAEVMTDLTTADLEYFEEAESLLKRINGDGCDISSMLAPKDDKEMITDLTSSDIDYLQLLGDVYGGGSRDAQADGEVDKDDKGTETELTIADIRDLEDQVDSSAEVKVMHPFQGFVSEDLRAETLVGLQSELDYLPILDEPEFILDEEDRGEGEDMKREETGVMTEMTIADIRDLEDQVESAAEIKLTPPVKEDYQFETLEGLQTELEFLPVLDEPEFVLDEETAEEVAQRQDTEVMTELTLADLENLEAVEERRRDEDSKFPERIETGIQCDLEDLTLLMQDLSKEAEERGENVPAWFVTAFQMRQPEGAGFNPVHLVVRESNGVDALPTDEHSDVESQFENILEETALANSPIDLINLSEDSPRSPHDITSSSSWNAEEGDAFSKDVGVQCDLVDFLTMLDEYQKNTNENVMPWFVSAMNMSRDDTGYDPVQVLLRERSDSSPVQDDGQSTSLMVELSRPPPPPRDSKSTAGFLPHEQLEDHQTEFPEADSPDPLFTSQDGTDSVFNRTDDSIIPPDRTEESDVLTDMPQSSSAVNRFDRFLKERKDSELLNLQVLKEDLDKSGNEDAADVKSLKELEEENELLRRRVQMLENTANAEELENELAALKEKVEDTEELEIELTALKEKVKSVNDLKEENQLLKNEINSLRESVSVRDLEEENQLRNTKELQNEMAALKEKVESVNDLEEENRLLKEEINILRESALVRDLEEENQLQNTEELQNELAALKEKVESVNNLEEENRLLKQEINILRESASVNDLEEENQLLKEEINILRESASVKDLEEENQLRNTEKLQNEMAALKEKVESVDDLEEENQLLKEEISILRESASVRDLEVENQLQNTEELQNEIAALKEKVEVSENVEEENAFLKDKIKMLEETAVAEQDVKEIEKENEELWKKVKTLEESTNTEDLEQENDFLKQQVEMLAADSERVKDLEEENELLQDKLQALEQSTNVQDLVNENSLLKERIELLVEPERVKELEDENEMLQEKVQTLEKSSAVAEDLLNENALLKEQIEIMEEAGRAKELEYENDMLKQKVKMLEESSTVERLENEQLMEKIQDLENSTARVVERLEEENAILKENIQILEDSTTNMKDLEDENALLRKKIESLGDSRNVQELEKENASLIEKIRSLEESSAGDMPNEEFELLKLKIEQLREAEKKIGALNEANVALKERIDLLQMEKKNVRENWSEMDPSEQLGKADRGVQAKFDDVPPSLRHLPGVSGGVNLLKLLEVAPDGSIPENIAKELEILKQENRELYEELMELRTKIKARQVAQRSNEATQTEHAYLSDSFHRDAKSVPGSIEETIAPQIRATVATEIRYLGDSYLEFEPSPQAPPIWVESLDLNGQDGLIDYPEVSKAMPSYNENVRDSDDLISEPELVSSRRNLDSVMDDIDRRIHDLQHLDQDMDRSRTDTSDLVLLDSDDDGDLPPLPESSPPPLPSEPLPDFPEASSPVLDYGIESLLSSPPRSAATLRASSRARSHSENKPSSETSQPSSRVESPVTVEEPTLVLASDPSELGSAYPKPSSSSPLSVRKPSGLGSTKVPPQVLPKHKKTLQMRQPGQLYKPLVSYDNTNTTPEATSQWSRDEQDGVIPPRGIVLNRASSINRGEIDTLNEKIGFLERQLKNKENVIRSMKTDATELETQSMLERKDREMKILEEDVAFLKKENQKKERELLTKIGEANKKNYEIEQWKAESNNSERQRQRMEAAYMNLQIQMKNLQGAELKLAELQTKYSAVEKQNFELSEKVQKLERTEKEFKKLEHTIHVLQAQVQEMDIVEQDRNSLVEKMKTVENQRDDLLRKGRVVESERNDFLRNNKLMEMQRDDLENRCAMLQKTNATLNSRLAELERDVKEAQTKMHDSHHERNFLQVQLDKMEAEKNEMQKRLAITTQERNSLENQVAELEDLSRDHVKLEDGFHTLRIKLAESTRDKDDAEMQIPTLKAKIALLKRACKEKDELVDKLSEEIRELRHAIATSALDDLSKIRTSGYTPENFVKLSAQREQERQKAKREPEDLVGGRLKSRLDKQSQRRSPRALAPSPPETKKAKRFVALFDYDPDKSPASEHPELELKLKEGDLLTVFGDMDINGYFEADVNGVRGLVPSLYVDELEDDNESDIGLEELLARSRRDPVKDVHSYKGNELLLQRDNVSSGHITPSSGASSVGSEPRQCMVALHDYDPFQTGASGRPAHEQLSLRKGDVLTAFGDIDVNGFYRVDLNGQTGFVPGHLVDEVSSSSLLQPTKTRAPEQILGMLNNIQVRGQPKGTSTGVFPPSGVTNGFPTHAHGDVTPPRHVQPPGSPLPSVGLTRFKPSPEVAKLGPSPRAVVVPVNSIQSSQPPAMPVVLQSVVMAKPSSPKQVVPVSSNKSRSSRKARPSPPSFFRVLRPVNHDAMLVGWTLPEMDEFGRSNGLTVKGYKIYANCDVKLEVRSPYMAKALVEDLELRFPIKFSIKTVAENGCSSEAVSTTFSNTIKGSIMDSFGESFEKDSGDDQKHYRTFVALYDYDPFSSSPNPNPASELSFKEGDILRVFDTSRKDGFYVGKLKSKSGLIPSNFVEEVAVASPRRPAAAKKRQASLPSPTRPFSRESSSSGGVGLPSLETKDPASVRRKMMVALYDYNPEVQSPQDNPDSELSFKKGQILAVLGEMRADGFYQADLNGQLGLVPGSFLDEYTNGEVDSGLDSERRVSFKKGRSQRHLGGLDRV